VIETHGSRPHPVGAPGEAVGLQRALAHGGVDVDQSLHLRDDRPALAKRSLCVGLRDTRRPVIVCTAMPSPASPTSELSPRQRKHLRALAHPLDPIVRVGKAGLSDPVLSAVSRALLDHELIKVRLYDPEEKRVMAAELATRSGAVLCGLLGHTVILYKRHPQRPRIGV